MGKKKGSKKKSSKKTGKKGSKKKAVVDTPNLTPTERFIKFQLDSRAEDLEDLIRARQETVENNEILRQKIQDAKIQRFNLSEALRAKTGELTAKFNEETAKCEVEIQQMQQKYEELIKENEQELKNLRATLKEKDSTIAVDAAELELLENHKLVVESDWTNQISGLKEAVEEIHRDFVKEKSDIERQFRMSRRHFEGHVDFRMTKLKDDASETAIDLQPADDKIAYSDYGLLRHELEEQASEHQRLKELIRTLATEYRRLWEEVFPHGRPSSRAQTASSVLLRATSPYPKSRMRTERPKTTAATPRIKTAPVNRIKGRSGRISSGFRARSDLGQYSKTQVDNHDSEEVLNNLRIFPALAKQGTFPAIEKKNKHRSRSTSLKLVGIETSQSKGLLQVL